MRLLFSLLTCAYLSMAATQWRAHYAPIAGPWGGTAQALAVDSSGNIFVAGAGESAGQDQSCLFKLDAQGNLRAQICFGAQTCAAVAVGSDGNPIVAGTTYSPASVTLISPLVSQANVQAGYVIKFKSDLSGILFSTLIGGTEAGALGGGTTVSALALDPTGNIYIGGGTADGNFPLTAGVFQSVPPIGAIPAFVMAISAAGDRILWSTLFGGPKPSCTDCNAGSATISNLAVDATGAVVIAGSAMGEQMPVTAGVIGPACLCTVNTQATFLAKLASGGSELAWGTYVNYTAVKGLALDAAGDVILGGQAYTGFIATDGALQASYPGGAQTYPDYADSAGFVAKLDPAATRYLFATWLGGNSLQLPISSYEILESMSGVAGMVVDTGGTIWLTGGSLPSELPLPASTPILGSNYLLGLSPDRSEVTAATTAPEGGAGLGIALSPQGPVALGRSGSILIPASAMPALAGITNSAGLTATGSVSPNELISIYGGGLGPSTGLSGTVSNGALTTSLGGVQVEFDGVAAPLLYAGPNQINAVVPSGVAGQSSTTVTIVTPGGQITGLVLSVATAMPAVFTYAAPGNPARAINQDGTLNSVTNPAAAGSTVSIWATGGGASGNPEVDGAITGTSVYPLTLPVSVGVGFPGAVPTAPVPNPTPAPVVRYSGDAPGLVKGEFQVNFQIPALAASAGTLQLYLHVGGGFSDPFIVYVR